MIPAAIGLARPCADCGTVGGHVHPGNRTPSRISGARFDIAGALCVKCYYKHRYRRTISPRRGTKWAAS